MFYSNGSIGWGNRLETSVCIGSYLRIAVSTSQTLMSHQSLLDEHAMVFVENPQKDIHSFIGTIKWNIGDACKIDSLSVDNVLWMNTVNASDVVVGLVCDPSLVSYHR